MPPWLLFNELENKACHYSIIVAQFRDRFVDSGSLQGDHVCYTKVTAICRST